MNALHFPHWSHGHHWHRGISALMWSTLALLGALAMVGFEAVAMRLLIGKW